MANNFNVTSLSGNVRSHKRAFAAQKFYMIVSQTCRDQMKKSTLLAVLISLCCFTLFLVWKSGYRYQSEIRNEGQETSQVILPANSTHDELCPLRNFVFVKTHKTGSSTMSNILLRYSENHKLNQLIGRSVFL